MNIRALGIVNLLGIGARQILRRHSVGIDRPLCLDGIDGAVLGGGDLALVDLMLKAGAPECLAGTRAEQDDEQRENQDDNRQYPRTRHHALLCGRAMRD
jgi:hypothetical protein